MLKITRAKSGDYWARHVKKVDLQGRGGYALVGDHLADAGDSCKMGRYADYSIVAIGVSNLAILIEVKTGAEDKRGSITIEGGRVIWSGDRNKEDKLVGDAAEWGATNKQLVMAKNPNYAAALFLHYRHEKSSDHLPEIGVSLVRADNLNLISTGSLHTLEQVDVEKLPAEYHGAIYEMLLEQADTLEALATVYRIKAGAMGINDG